MINTNRLVLIFVSVIKIYLVLFMLFFVFIKATPAKAASSNNLYILINDARTQESLNKLVINDNLTKSAKTKLNDILKYKYWSHDNPITHQNWDVFIRNTGYKGVIGENLAINYEDDKEILTAWINSSTHKENIFNEKYKHVGIAVGDIQISKEKVPLVVVHFGE